MANALSTRESGALSTGQWQVMREQADVLVKTGFLPVGVKTPEQALAIMLKGRELGVPSMHALSTIAVINGKPVCGAELMLALIYRDHGDDAVQFVHTDATRATISYRRRGWSNRQTFTFSIEDAQRAGVAGKGTWQQYPAAMLRARAISAVARLAFPDTIGGMYLPDELGAVVDVETGEITEVPITPEPTPAARKPPSRDALWRRIDALENQARELELPFDRPADDASEADLIAYGTALRANVDGTRRMDVLEAATA